jgi:PAS domain S-box-containing protein
LGDVSVAEPHVQSVLLGDAIEHAPAAVFVADDDSHYVAANACACELVGYTRQELLGLKVTDVARYPEAGDEFGEMIEQRGRTGRSILQRKDGSELVFEYRAGETKIAGMTYYVAVGWPAE